MAWKGGCAAHVEFLPLELVAFKAVPDDPRLDLSQLRLAVGGAKADWRSFLIVAILWILPVLRPITSGERSHLGAGSRDQGRGMIPRFAGY